MKFLCDLPEHNLTLNAPEGMEGEVDPVTCERDETGFIVTLEFDKEERLRVLDGGRLRVKILGDRFPPVAVWVVDGPDRSYG
jgi:hypothetical protein